MRKIIFMLAMICSTSILAQTPAQTASAGSLAGAAVNQNFAASDLSNAVPNAMAPGLATTLTETCMGSTSFGGSFAGGGLSFGTTWRDGACVRRLDARQVAAFGEIAGAVEMMCDSDKVREAFIRAGRPCVADGGHPRGIGSAPIQEQTVATEISAAPVVTQQVKE